VLIRILKKQLAVVKTPNNSSLNTTHCAGFIFFEKTSHFLELNVIITEILCMHTVFRVIIRKHSVTLLTLVSVLDRKVYRDTRPIGTNQSVNRFIKSKNTKRPLTSQYNTTHTMKYSMTLHINSRHLNNNEHSSNKLEYRMSRLKNR